MRTKDVQILTCAPFQIRLWSGRNISRIHCTRNRIMNKPWTSTELVYCHEIHTLFYWRTCGNMRLHCVGKWSMWRAMIIYKFWVIGRSAVQPVFTSSAYRNYVGWGSLQDPDEYLNELDPTDRKDYVTNIALQNTCRSALLWRRIFMDWSTVSEPNIGTRHTENPQHFTGRKPSLCGSTSKVIRSYSTRCNRTGAGIKLNKNTEYLASCAKSNTEDKCEVTMTTCIHYSVLSLFQYPV